MTAQRRMRVLHVGKYYPPQMGGIETHLKTLCTELHKSLDVQVAVSSGERSGWSETVEGVPVFRAGTPFNIVGAPVCPSLVRQIRDSKADLVHIHLPNPGALLAYIASGHRGKLVLSYHSDVVRQKILGRAFEPILHYVLRRADAIIVATPDYISGSTVLERYRDRCEVIPYGIPLEQFDQPESPEVKQIRDQYGPELVVAVGRLVYYKGFEFLVDAMRHVTGRLVIVGDGPLKRRLQERIKQNGLDDRVSLLGKAPDVTPYYHASDIFVLPSVARSEAFGIVQLEAMACGKAVVNTQLDSGVPFVSRHGVTGLTVPPRDPKALASAINMLLADANERQRFGSAARMRVEQEFTREVMAARTLALYEQVMSSEATSSVESPSSSRNERHDWRSLGVGPASASP